MVLPSAQSLAGKASKWGANWGFLIDFVVLLSTPVFLCKVSDNVGQFCGTIKGCVRQMSHGYNQGAFGPLTPTRALPLTLLPPLTPLGGTARRSGRSCHLWCQLRWTASGGAAMSRVAPYPHSLRSFRYRLNP